MTQPSAGELPVGTVLRDTYEICSVLGRGGMGSVFLARHLRLPGKQVAIKVLRKNVELGPDVYVRFRREAEIASRLGHPNIIEVLDFNTLEDGAPFLVMEYLQGQSLARRLKKGRLSLEEIFDITRQIGAALQAAHRAGVVHRDLKPDNVFLIPNETGGAGERVKLLDFGISKILDSQTLQTQDSVLLGTPRYMAPEQAMGKNREVDARSDLFSLGCLVYEMLAGKGPFAGLSLPEFIYRIVHEAPEPLAPRAPEAPAHVVEAVERALSKRPDDRQPDVDTFITELTGSPLQTLAGQDPAATAAGRRRPAESAPPSSPRTTEPRSETPAPEARPKTKPARVAGVAAVALMGLAALFVWLRPGASSAPASEPVSPVAVTQPAPAAPPSAPPSTPPSEAPVERAAGTPSPAPDAPLPSSTGTPARQTAQQARPQERQAPAEVLPEAARKDLESAEQALTRGEVDEAIRLGRRSQRVVLSGASYALLTRAHCRDRDLSNARAQWAQVPASERSRVRQYCKLYEIPL
ncbi:protein kinase domain-containing protein [Archangium gephyra]|uniref:serine/threonine-protein kinase n=1 Tax=Archangium gephyra TaxID=48 RepID=UPI003B76EEC0